MRVTVGGFVGHYLKLLAFEPARRAMSELRNLHGRDNGEIASQAQFGKAFKMRTS
jgi:hypothetical protein